MTYNYEDQVQALVDYFKSGEKDQNNWKIGVEFEHIIIDEKSLETVSIYGENGVSETIGKLEDLGWSLEYFEGYSLGASKGPYTVSTEPAGQFELSIEASKSIEELERLYILFLEEVLPLIKDQGQRLVAIGYQPKTKIDEIKISPKKRYGYMYEHFKTRGKRSHNMMKGTAAVQVIIDYKDEEDFVRKYRLGSYLSPILYTIFENAYIFEGEPYERHGLREYIWKNTDPSRSGLLESAFDQDFSYRSYAEYILNNDMIFLDDDKGLRSTEGKLFKEIFDPDDYTEDEIFHAVSIVFPDIRLKKYLEYRMMDSLPYPLNFAPVSLVGGIFYSEDNMKALEEAFDRPSFEEIKVFREETMEKGLEADFRGRTVKDWGLWLIDLAKTPLEPRAKTLLDPLEKHLSQGLSPRDKFKKIYDEEGLEEAIKIEIVEV